MSRGVVFFNFGAKCMARLFVAVHSLRQVYQGPITMMFAKDDEWCEKVAPDFQNVYNCDIQWFDLERTVKRNLKSVLKPLLFEASPYETTLMFDGDLLFQHPIDELFEMTEETGFVVTEFMNWKSSGKSMAKRIERVLGPVFNEKQMTAALDNKPAVNVGVLGYNRTKGGKLLRKWKAVTKQVAGQFIADEIAMQGVYFWYDHTLAPTKYNYSCHFGDNFEDAVIIHYHGNKHTSVARRSSRLWWCAVGDIIAEGQINMLEWLYYDKDARGVIQQSKDFKTEMNTFRNEKHG